MPITPISSEASLRRIYDQQIRAWFGEVRPLRLEGAGKYFTPPPALPLRSIFVPPALSSTHLQPTAEPPIPDHGSDILDWLGRRLRLVVLGDPGSGKSTLVSWLAWRLCAGLSEPLPDWCQDMLPVPMVLRDMKLSEVTCFDDLLTAFGKTELITAHPQLHAGFETLLRERMEKQPHTLLFLIDGLDEMSAAVSPGVRKALQEGFAAQQAARFVVTSRIVGYDESPLDSLRMLVQPQPVQLKPEVGSLWWNKPLSAAVEIRKVDVQRLYVVPFDDDRIRWFAQNWFSHGESPEQRGDTYFRKFLNNLMRDPVALQLARTPNLLVMAAQVFGISNTLPDGRSRLYEAITKAYLESIDQRYGLADSRYSLEEKKTWLSALGYRMQKRRAESSGNERELLASEAEVVQWLQEAFEETGADISYIKSFVDAIARRSGLFIPRGEQQYAFAHLSIQEYFAALHLQYRIRESALAEPQQLENWLNELQEWSDLSSSRETLITFFELTDWKPKETIRLWNVVFGENLSRVPSEVTRNYWLEKPSNSIRVELLSRLAVNPRISLPQTRRDEAFDAAWRYLKTERTHTSFTELIRSGNIHNYSKVLSSLTVNSDGSQRLWSQLIKEANTSEGTPNLLDLRGASFTDISPLTEPVFKHVKALALDDVPVVDLPSLKELRELNWLSLAGTAIRNIAPFSALPQLLHLNLSDTKVEDFLFMKEAKNLHSLKLDNTNIKTLKPIEHLIDLEYLTLEATPIDDFSLLSKFKNLKTLHLSQTTISDLSPIAGLNQLESLELGTTNVSDLTPLKDTTSLEHLDINNTQVQDLLPLKNLNQLRYLWLFGTPIADVSALSGLKNLEILHAGSTRITNVGPLSHLRRLTILGIEPNKSAKSKKRGKSQPIARKARH